MCLWLTFPFSFSLFVPRGTLPLAMYSYKTNTLQDKTSWCHTCMCNSAFIHLAIRSGAFHQTVCIGPIFPPCWLFIAPLTAHPFWWTRLNTPYLWRPLCSFYSMHHIYSLYPHADSKTKIHLGLLIYGHASLLVFAPILLNTPLGNFFLIDYLLIFLLIIFFLNIKNSY